jgi:hypothetical protein
MHQPPEGGLSAKTDRNALAHDPEKACPALDAGREAVFRKDQAQNNQ